jgi:tRNA dimethylallyltransferase
VGLDAPRELLERRIRERTEAMFDRGVEEEVRRALAQPMSSTARYVIGLSEVADLPRDEAVAAIVRRTLRYAAYQRKWLRRIPGVVSLTADRTPEEIAREVLEVARARQRLPAGSTG